MLIDFFGRSMTIDKWVTYKAKVIHPKKVIPDSYIVLFFRCLCSSTNAAAPTE